jgi:zinc/manganese transport system ATP-binding protein
MNAERTHRVGPQRTSSDLILRNVSFGYGAALAVREMSGQFASGSMTAIMGPNGGGKTTLLKGLLGLLRPLRGTVESRHPRSALGYLAQASEVEPEFPISVEDFVAVGLWSRIGGLRAVPPTLASRVAEAIAAVGLQDRASRWIGELSGGQFQRMRFARLLAQDPAMVMLDEPFAGVDERTTAALLRLIHGWHAQGKTLIAVLHDQELVRAHFPQTLLLAGQVLAWGDTCRVLSGPELARLRA